MSTVHSVPQQPLVVPGRSKQALTKIARWILYVSAALAVPFGLLVWPMNVYETRGVHAVFGWLVIAALWTLAGVAARSGVSRSTVWSAVGWGVLTGIGASAQHQLRPGTWITVLHVVTGLGAIGWGRHLLTRMRHAMTHSEATLRTGVPISVAAADFLAKKRIAVTGVSSKPAQHGSNVVYRRLRERGYEVFAINPNRTQVEGDRCFRDLVSVPGGVDAVVIATRSDHAMATMRECADLGIKQVWMHRSVGVGSVSEEAAAWGRQQGIQVLAGGCPLMFDPAADTGHKVMRSLFTLTGKVPRRV